MKSRDDSALHSSNNEKSEIDIILPNYNKFNYLKEAIDSVINQTFQDWHLYIIDDCSNDGTRDFVLSLKDKRIRYYRNSFKSYPAKSRNAGIKKSNGEIISFLDDDDEMYDKFFDLPEQISEYAEAVLPPGSRPGVRSGVNRLPILNATEVL